MGVEVKRCLNIRCPHKDECEYGIRQKNTLEMFKGDKDSINKFGAKPIYPSWVVCQRYKEE